ncbi:hypothetical protein BCR37DRAFT_383429 [Protomyces lactucae-debilis]|uniref:Uncharacterized protein n=1 Tax=Protomyces lactucae-debilis TaxID=2754530 RepID=A0A1Y2EXQ0_PROLT|nr:uncharacterized protein BCR37DRAFT_383429 [Protomyces lactucae-debilis]ORY76350.1 hypothetical protein BCR37DRAFT_383429 [Protomyces lactucae-debilis]
MAIFQHGAKNMQVFQSRHKEHLAEARQGTDDENDKQARQARRTAQNTASNKEQDDNNDTEPAQPRRTGKRSQPMTAKAQLLQTAANDKDYCAATSGELEQAWKRSKRARYHAQQLKGVHKSRLAICSLLHAGHQRSPVIDR